jgi:hypothetical protein
MKTDWLFDLIPLKQMRLIRTSRFLEFLAPSTITTVSCSSDLLWFGSVSWTDLCVVAAAYSSGLIENMSEDL